MTFSHLEHLRRLYRIYFSLATTIGAHHGTNIYYVREKQSSRGKRGGALN